MSDVLNGSPPGRSTERANARRARRWLRPSTVATVTAIAAIALGVWDSVQNRRHNRLSVAPHLVCDLTVSATPGETTFSVHLTNEGVGPAIIESVEIALPESLGGGVHPDWTDVVPMLRARGLEVPSYWNYVAGAALGVEGQRELLRVSVAKSDSAPAMLQRLAAIRVVVNYESVYGDKAQARLDPSR